MGKIMRNGVPYCVGGDDAFRYVNDVTDENYGWIQYRLEDGSWVNYKQVETLIYPLYMSSANEGGFSAYAGSATGGYTRITPTLVKAESLKVSFKGTLDSNAFYVGCAISKEIDLTRFTTLRFTHSSSGTNGSSSTNGTFFITSTKGTTMTPIVTKTLFNAYDLNNQSGEKVIDISSLNGTFYIGIEVRAYDLATATVSISNMYME